MTRPWAFCWLSLLLAAGGCRTSEDTRLKQAAARGSAGAIRALLLTGVDPDDTAAPGDTPLMLAARGGHTEAMKVLIEAGADIDRRDEAVNGWTPLMHAVHKRQGEAVRVLLEAGADPNARSRGGVTALMMAAGYGDTEAVRMLLARGADPRAEAPGGLTALWGAVGGGAIADITDGPPLGSCHPETVRALQEKAPDLRLRNDLPTRAVSWLARSEECARLVASLRTP